MAYEVSWIADSCRSGQWSPRGMILLLKLSSRDSKLPLHLPICTSVLLLDTPIYSIYTFYPIKKM